MLNCEMSESTPILANVHRENQTGFPRRYVFLFFGFVGFCNVYAMRVNLSVALVAMVNKTSAVLTSGHVEVMACPQLISNATLINENENAGEFNWNARTQSIILGSFFYGYVITQIPGGLLAERNIAKWLFGFGVLATSVLTIVTPAAAWWGIGPIICVRIIEGLAEGVTFPAMNTLIGRWAPKMERSRMSTFIFAGSPVGTVVAMAISGFLAGSKFLGGWPSIFYVFGTLGCIWFFFWISHIYESPSVHPNITQEELQFIHENQERRQPGPVPWWDILTSIHVWALALTHFGHNWGFYTLLTEMPTYLSTILHFNIKQNGVLSSLPYMLQFACAVLASFLADSLRKLGHFKITTIRKIMNSIAFFGPGICVLLVAFVGCSPIIILALLCTAMGLNGFIYSGFNVTHVDMSPNYAGTLMGITNCVSNFSGFIAPYVVGVITSKGQTIHNWSLVFAITSAVYFFTGVLYNIFCSAELQPWDSPAVHDAPSVVVPKLMVNTKKQTNHESKT